MCSEHGPSLSMDKQLYWILQQKIFHSLFILLDSKYPLCTPSTRISYSKRNHTNYQIVTINHNSYSDQNNGIYFRIGNFISHINIYGISYESCIPKLNNSHLNETIKIIVKRKITLSQHL